MSNATAKMPFDYNGNPVQTLGLSSSTNSLSVAAASANVALPAGVAAGDIVRVACTTDAYIEFGDSGVTAAQGTSAIFTTGVEVLKVPRGATHIAAVRIAADGFLSVTELE